jgi:hypothetical protein
VPGVIEAATNTDLGNGFGTLCYGIALLFIGGVRMTRGGGVGWQALIGVLLVALGGSEMALPEAATLVLPLLLVVFGLILLTRDRSGLGRTGRTRPHHGIDGAYRSATRTSSSSVITNGGRARSRRFLPSAGRSQ